MATKTKASKQSKKKLTALDRAKENNRKLNVENGNLLRQVQNLAKTGTELCGEKNARIADLEQSVERWKLLAGKLAYFLGRRWSVDEDDHDFPSKSELAEYGIEELSYDESEVVVAGIGKGFAGVKLYPL